GSDCNDANANINPSVAEVCNGIDDNCDTQADEGLIFTTYYVDADGDGFGSTTSLVACSNPGTGYVLNNTDCNDNDILVYTSSSLYIDVDGDGYDAGTSVQCYGATLPSGYIASTLGSDCNDANANVHPNATEVCNGIDDDCDTQVDENAFITSIQPSTAAIGATITLSGSGFTGITTILFGTIPASNFTVVDDNTITVEVPTGAVDGFITISNNICGPITSGSIFTVTPSAASLHLKVFIQGFYVGGGQMTPVLFNNGLSTDPNAVDSLTIELHDANSPYSLVEAQVVILDVNGDAVAQFPGNTIGNSYYVVVKHRNSIETWSKDPVLIQSNTLFDLAH
ncbi:MAG TPA: MopE-related protein, partial [Bacteroidia bacterium]|nr:MopE-related protein [Bacteroidia bacterium]